MNFRYLLLVPAILLSFIAKSQSNALNFDGVNDFVNVNPMMPYSGDFTLETWFNTSDPNTTFFAWGGPGVNNYLNFGLNTGQPRLALGNGTNISQLDGIGNWNDGTWHHIAVTKSASTVLFYVDGLAAGSGVVTNSAGAYSFSSIGAGLFNNIMQGFAPLSMDELKIWNVAKSAAYFSSNYNCNLEIGRASCRERVCYVV